MLGIRVSPLAGVAVGAGEEGVEDTARAGEEGGVGSCLAGSLDGEGGGGISPSCPERALCVWQFRQSHSFCKKRRNNSIFEMKY